MEQVTLVGLGASAATLTAEGAQALRGAVRIVGARRLLEALPPAFEAERIAATRFEDVLAAVLSSPGPCAALYSGDTGFYSGAAGLLERLARQQIPARVVPGISSVQLLAARLGRPWQDWKLVSAHGTGCDPVAEVCGGRPVFFLTGGKDTGPADLCARLTEAGLGNLSVTAGENLACPGETITSGTAAELAERTFGPLAVLLVQPAPRAADRTPGWPDETFTRAEAIPMTKQAIRAQILAQLALRPGETAWDVGAGTGSVSLELAFANGGAPVYAVECLPEACALLRENRRRLGGWNIRVVEGKAPAALAGLPAPDVVFIGGTRGELKEILSAVWEANPDARVCVTAVTVETLAAAVTGMTALGRKVQVTQIGAAHTGEGKVHLLRAENPIFLITAHR